PGDGLGAPRRGCRAAQHRSALRRGRDAARRGRLPGADAGPRAAGPEARAFGRTVGLHRREGPLLARDASLLGTLGPTLEERLATEMAEHAAKSVAGEPAPLVNARPELQAPPAIPQAPPPPSSPASSPPE